MTREASTLPQVHLSAAKRVLFAVNPKSGGRQRRELIDECIQLLSAKGFSVAVETSIDALCQRAVEQEAEGALRTVVSAGGDGTLALLANRLPVGTPISILPLGTENLVARYLGCKSTAACLAATVEGGVERRWDVGIANGRCFLAMLGTGFDAEVVSQVHAARRGHISYFTYLSPIFRTMATYQYPEIRVSCWKGEASEPEVFRARWVFIANLAKYALGLSICPAARVDDSLLHATLLARSGLFRGLLYLWKIWRGTHLADPTSVSLAGVRFRLESDVAVPYQLDGDPGGVLPVEVTVEPERLRLLVPG